MAWGCFISDLRGTLSKYLKKMGKTPAGSLGSLNITIVCLVADLRHMRTNGDTHDSFDTQHAMTSDLNVKSLVLRRRTLHRPIHRGRKSQSGTPSIFGCFLLSSFFREV
jgi:hypothetical protein